MFYVTEFTEEHMSQYNDRGWIMVNIKSLCF